MDTFSLILGLIFMGIFIIPILIFQRSQNKALRKLSKSFNRVAISNGINVNQSDFWDNTYGIGIDSKNNKLLYIKHNNTSELVTVLDVADVETCSIEKQSENHNLKHKHKTVLNHVNLVITHRNAAQTKDLLEFYDESVSLRLNSELMLAEKWQKVISGKIAKARA